MDDTVSLFSRSFTVPQSQCYITAPDNNSRNFRINQHSTGSIFQVINRENKFQPNLFSLVNVMILFISCVSHKYFPYSNFSAKCNMLLLHLIINVRSFIFLRSSSGLFVIPCILALVPSNFLKVLCVSVY